MPRIRSIKPDFFTSDTVSALPLRARLTWIGLWTHCDDQGRCRDNVKLVKAAVWPLDDVSLRDIEDDLAILTSAGRIVRYLAAVDGKEIALVQVVNWDEHQRVNRPSKVRFPPPSTLSEYSVNGHSGLSENGHASPQVYPHSAGERDSVSPHGTLTEGSSQEGSREQGAGRGTRARAPKPPPPRKPRCPKHIDLPDDEPGPNCLGCRDARLNAEREASQAQLDQRLVIRACPFCDPDGWRYEFGRRIVATPYVRCDHTPPDPPETR